MKKKYEEFNEEKSFLNNLWEWWCSLPAAKWWVIIIAVFCFSMVHDIVTEVNDSEVSGEELVAYAAEQSSLPEQDSPFELVEVARDPGSYAKGEVGFKLYRDSVTDVLFVWGGLGQSAGLTTMPDPETGKPLTYSRYMELAGE